MGSHEAAERDVVARAWKRFVTLGKTAKLNHQYYIIIHSMTCVNIIAYILAFKMLCQRFIFIFKLCHRSTVYAQLRTATEAHIAEEGTRL